MTPFSIEIAAGEPPARAFSIEVFFDYLLITLIFPPFFAPRPLLPNHTTTPGLFAHHFTLLSLGCRKANTCEWSRNSSLTCFHTDRTPTAYRFGMLQLLPYDVRVVRVWLLEAGTIQWVAGGRTKLVCVTSDRRHIFHSCRLLASMP